MKKLNLVKCSGKNCSTIIDKNTAQKVDVFDTDSKKETVEYFCRECSRFTNTYTRKVKSSWRPDSYYKEVQTNEWGFPIDYVSEKECRSSKNELHIIYIITLIVIIVGILRFVYC